MPTPQNAWGDSNGKAVTVSGIAVAGGSYTTGQVIGTSFAIPDIANGGDRGFIITDEFLFFGAAPGTAPAIDLILFGSNPGLTDAGALVNLAAAFGAVANTDFTWIIGSTGSIAYAHKVFARRVAGSSIWAALVARATITVPLKKDGVMLTIGTMKD